MQTFDRVEIGYRFEIPIRSFISNCVPQSDEYASSFPDEEKTEV